MNLIVFSKFPDFLCDRNKIAEEMAQSLFFKNIKHLFEIIQFNKHSEDFLNTKEKIISGLKKYKIVFDTKENNRIFYRLFRTGNKRKKKKFLINNNYHKSNNIDFSFINNIEKIHSKIPEINIIENFYFKMEETTKSITIKKKRKNNNKWNDVTISKTYYEYDIKQKINKVKKERIEWKEKQRMHAYLRSVGLLKPRKEKYITYYGNDGLTYRRIQTEEERKKEKYDKIDKENKLLDKYTFYQNYVLNVEEAKKEEKIV